MKILLLNQNSDAQRKVIQYLKGAGVAVLSPISVDEAWQTLQLHGSSVDLAIVHREGQGGVGEPGLELVHRIKTSESQSDLPLVVTYEKWTEDQAAQHQTGPEGANAYLPFPFTDIQLKGVIEAVLGQGLSFNSATAVEAFEVAPTPAVPTASRVQKGAPPPPQGSVSTTTAAVSKATESTSTSTSTSTKSVPEKASSKKDTGSLQLVDESLQDPSVMFKMDLPSTGEAVLPESLSGPEGLEALSNSIQLQSPNAESVQLPEISLGPPDASVSSIAIPTAPPGVPSGPKKAEKEESTLQIQIASSDGMELERGGNQAQQAAGFEVPPTVPLTDSSQSMSMAIPSDPSELLPPANGSYSHLSLTGVNAMKGTEASQAIEPSIALPDAQNVKPAEALPFSIEKQAETSVQTPAPVQAKEEAPADDVEAVKEMPYLFGKAERPAESAAALAAFAQPVGDAVVPGGAAQSPDLDTLKKYLLLREQDVAALSSQLKTVREQVSALEDQLKVEKIRSGELEHMVEQQKRRIETYDQEKQQTVELLQSEINELRFQMRAKSDKAVSLEAQVRTAADEIEQIKKRVRVDIRKIRMREKELENKLEIMRKDSEALISSRESKIIELKRKLDLVEFNMDLLQDQHSRERDLNRELKGRLAKASQAMKVAGGLLNADEQPTQPGEESKDAVSQIFNPERKAV